ncbi:MAG: transglycosylase SLT domain-containing protein [Chitinispirillales bacterium]|jgi:Rod binding domain-containing protein|nr:transglycosylase SLT domain-containing protein [Chitinispirillales bacterium]
MITENIKAASATSQEASRKARMVAQEFEAMFTSMMLKSMRKNIPEGSFIKTGMGEKIFTEMLDDEYSKMMASKGSMGLADLIFKEIERSEGRGLPSTKDLKGVPLWAMEKRSGNTADTPPRGISDRDSTSLLNRVSGRWESLIAEISERHGVDKNLVTAVIACESAGNPNAISNKGAKGLMQLMDGTAKEMGVKYSFSPAENINGGVKYLKNMLTMFDGDERLALASYNAGPGAVRKHGGIPPFKETQEYVNNVLKLKNKAATADTAAKVNEVEDGKETAFQ